MTDARWLEVFDDMRWSVEHFGRAGEIARLGGFEGPALEPYKSRMALMQAMQAGHTSLESGLERILDILGEAKPVGASYHADLVHRAAREVPGSRPPIIDKPLARAIDETRRFRHIARKNYNMFEISEAGRALEAAAEIHQSLLGAIEDFRSRIELG